MVETEHDFGHVGLIGPGFCIDSWGVGPFVIHVGAAKYRFEDSDRFGPTLIYKNGEPKKEQPGGRSHFWLAHRMWRTQGMRLDDDDITCVYDPPRPTTYKKVGRANFIVEDGDEGGGFVEVFDA